MLIFESCLFSNIRFFHNVQKELGYRNPNALHTSISSASVTFSEHWNKSLNIDLLNHDLDTTENFEEALKNDIIIYDE